MLDRYLTGSVDRISPEAPVPVVRVEAERWALGGAGNVAANVVALGADCESWGASGRIQRANSSGRLSWTSVSGNGPGGAEGPPHHGQDSDHGPPPTRNPDRPGGRHPTSPNSKPRDLPKRSVAVGPQASAIAVEDYNKGVLVPSLIQGNSRRRERAVDSYCGGPEEASVF